MIGGVREHRVAMTGEGSAEGGARGEVDPVAYAFLGMMILITSTTATAAKVAVRELPTGLIPLIRLLTAALCVPINQTFFLNGTKLAPTTHVALSYAACPLVVLALATAIGQERP